MSADTFAAGLEAAAKLCEVWRDENKAAAAKARKSISEGARTTAEMLDGAAIEANALALAIRAIPGDVRPTPTSPVNDWAWCPTCGGQFDGPEYRSGSACPECETPFAARAAIAKVTEPTPC